MIGGVVETSASFEARSAPRSYPTVTHDDDYVTKKVLQIAAIKAMLDAVTAGGTSQAASPLDRARAS
jgi:hypothetical protein